MRSIAKRVQRGSAIGLAFGVLYIAWLGILVLLNGPVFFESRGINVPVLAVAYLSAGLTSGAVVGAMEPYLRKWHGAATVGFVVAMPVIHLIGLADIQTDSLSADALWTTIATAVLVGPLGGVAIWMVFSDRLRR